MTQAELEQEIGRLTNTTPVQYPSEDKTARLNQALDRFFALALLGDGDWQFDDTNYTDLPIGVTNLVSGQYDYSFALELLVIQKVFVADISGNFHELVPIDVTERAADNIYTQPSGNSGTPYRYDVIGNSMLLDPKPNYSFTNGLKVVFKRNATRFVIGITEQEPGIPSVFHLYLARYASLPYLLSNRLANSTAVAAQIAQDEDAIQDFLAHRSKHRKTKITTVWRSSR